MKGKVLAPWLIALALGIVLLGVWFIPRKGGEEGPNQNEVADRVLKVGKIRAAYALVPPAVLKDPKTGELSGIFVDTLKEMGHRLSLEVEFTEEVGWDAMIAGLTANRYDVVCTQIWPSGARAREAAFSRPLYYVGVGVYVRPDDTRFDKDLSAINDPVVRVGMLDGTTGDIIQRVDFPRATRVSLPGLGDPNQQLLEVVHKRADVAFLHTTAAEAFIRNNPGSLRNSSPDRPIRVFPNTFMVKRNQQHWLTMLDTAIEELGNSGFVEKTIRKYERTPGEIMRVAVPYRTLR